MHKIKFFLLCSSWRKIKCIHLRASQNQDIWMVIQLLELGKRLPVNGKGEDITTTANNAYDKFYQPLLKELLGKPETGLDPGNTPFQIMVQDCKLKPGPTSHNILQRIFYLAEKNPDKCSEKNMAGKNLYHIAHENPDNYTASVLVRLLVKLRQMDEKDNITNDGTSILHKASKK